MGRSHFGSTTGTSETRRRIQRSVGCCFCPEGWYCTLRVSTSLQAVVLLFFWSSEALINLISFQINQYTGAWFNQESQYYESPLQTGKKEELPNSLLTTLLQSGNWKYPARTLHRFTESSRLLLFFSYLSNPSCSRSKNGQVGRTYP